MRHYFGLSVAGVLVLWSIWRRRYLHTHHHHHHSLENDVKQLNDHHHISQDEQKAIEGFPNCTKIIVCQDGQSCNAAIAELLASVSNVSVLGLDVEWRPKRDKNEDTQPVAVAQLSSASVTLVIQLLYMDQFPSSLRELLQNKKVLKVGVGVGADGLALQRSYGVDVRGCLELELLLARTVNCGGIHGFSGGTSLKALSHSLLNVELDKNPQLRCSDWSEKVLSQAQIVYAAADAYYSWAIFERLMRIRLEMKGDKEELDEATFNGFVAGLIDIRREKHQSKLQQQQQQQQPQKKSGKDPSRPSRFESITKNLYDNFRVEGPNGEFMFTCDRKKRNWYLDRNLATTTEENPTVLRLTFQPKGLGNQGSAFYEEGLDNKCVVCGTEQRLVRHNVIPHSYRRHFPLRIKSHSSHDVVLMCVPCHTQAQSHSEYLKRVISEEMKIPLNAPQEMVTIDHAAQKTRNAALALTGPHATRIPLEKRKELLTTVGQHFGCPEDEVTADMLQDARELTHRSILPPEDAHEAHVVQTIFDAEGIGGIHAFCKRWREHMVNNLHPKFLSPHWDVNFIKPNDADLIPGSSQELSSLN